MGGKREAGIRSQLFTPFYGHLTPPVYLPNYVGAGLIQVIARIRESQ